MPRAVTVFCAASERIDPPFFAAAETLGARLGQRGDTLVYGGGRVGLMGALARAVHAHGGRVVGVMPAGMKTVE
ncbi:MAG: LOG family protein, partial [Phycisphaeraceae bacterium]